MEVSAGAAVTLGAPCLRTAPQVRADKMALGGVTSQKARRVYERRTESRLSFRLTVLVKP